MAQEWDSIQADPARAGRPRQVVPGIIGVSQRLVLFDSEWQCAGCHQVIEGDERGFFIRHLDGCDQVATITEIQPMAGP